MPDAGWKDDAKLPDVSNRKLKRINQKITSRSAFRVPHLLVAFGALAIAAIAFLWFQTRFGRVETKTISVGRVVPFSGATGRENTPAFSPDGKQLVFSWNGGEDGGSSDIYIRLINAVEPVRLTDSKFHEQYPTFSPDGAHIAFVREFGTHGEVILIPTLGGAERRVARLFTGNFSVSFAPDGESLAVIDTADSVAGENKQYAVYTVNLQTGAQTPDRSGGIYGRNDAALRARRQITGVRARSRR